MKRRHASSVLLALGLGLASSAFATGLNSANSDIEGVVFDKHTNSKGLVTDFMVRGEGETAHITVVPPNEGASRKICQVAQSQSVSRVHFDKGGFANVYRGMTERFGQQ